MSTRVYLHIGAPKSGTTFLQTVLWANQASLREAGFLLPGRKKFDHNRAAAWARSNDPSQPTQQTWQRLVREIRSWPGPAILSNEWFTMATKDQVHRLLSALAPADVHVVFTARNLLDTVPAAWQETLKLGHASSLSSFVAGLGTTDDERWNWATLDASDVLSRWDDLPPDHVHVVTLPPRGSDRSLLWERFASSIGLPADVCNLHHGVANESLSAEGARLLQIVGLQLRSAVDAEHRPWHVPYHWIRDFFSHELVVPQKGHRIALAEVDERCIRQRIESSVAGLAAAGYVFHGDLSDLTHWSPPDDALHPDDVPAEAVLDVVSTIIPAMLKRLQQQDSRLRGVKKKQREMQPRRAAPGWNIGRRWRRKVVAVTHRLSGLRTSR